MAQFAVLLYAPTPADPMATPEDEIAAHTAFGMKVAELGVKILDGYAVQESTAGKSVRGTQVFDGAFLQAEHVITGFFILEADDLDQAIEIAKASPATWRGGVEVRPLFVPPSA